MLDIYVFNDNVPFLYIQPTTTIVAMTTIIPAADIVKYMYIFSKAAVCPKNTRKRHNILALYDYVP
jgi:hypothetical protein